MATVAELQDEVAELVARVEALEDAQDEVAELVARVEALEDAEAKRVSDSGYVPVTLEGE